MLVKPANGPDGATGWLYTAHEAHEDALHTIIQIDADRYGGCYSCAAFTAWPGIRPTEIDAGDPDCDEFWRDHRDALHGAGNSAQEAFRDLQRKIEEGGYWNTGSLRAVFLIDDIGADRSAAFVAGSDAFLTWLEQEDSGQPCAACASRVKNWNGDNPKCGFLGGGHFTTENWNCATVIQMRGLCVSGHKAVDLRHHDEQWAASIDLGAMDLPDDTAPPARTLWVSWYKSRGRTEAMWLLDEFAVPRRPTEAECLAILKGLS